MSDFLKTFGELSDDTQSTIVILVVVLLIGVVQVIRVIKGEW
jgi:hypothetical protein